MNDNFEGVEIPVKVKRVPIQLVTEQAVPNEREWAAAAHIMGALMVFLMFFGPSMVWLFPMAITAGIYLYYQDKSALIKDSAREAFVMQVLGSFGWLALLVSGTVIWAVLLVISLVLILVLVGLLLAPIVAVAYPLFLLASLALPLTTALFGVLGAVSVLKGEPYRYPYVADRLDQYLGVAA